MEFNIAQVHEAVERAVPDRECIVFRQRRLTYRDVGDRSRQIANAIDFIVQIGRLPNGTRRILSISEITGLNDSVVAMQELFRHESVLQADGQEGDRWVAMGVMPHSPKIARLRQSLQAQITDRGHA